MSRMIENFCQLSESVDPSDGLTQKFQLSCRFDGKVQVGRFCRGERLGNGSRRTP
jgi:hypothetical protein